MCHICDHQKVREIVQQNSIVQDFINYSFLYTTFCAQKTVFGANPCTWGYRTRKGADMHDTHNNIMQRQKLY